MLSRTIRFFTTAEVAIRLGVSPRQAERQMRALALNPWLWDDRAHWSERDVLLAEERYGVQRAFVVNADYSMRSRDVAAYLGISMKLLERLIGRGLRHEIDRVKPGTEWLYARSTVELYREKRDRVRREKLWRAVDIGKHFGVTPQSAMNWVRGDPAHFPKPVLKLAGIDYWIPAKVKAYKRDQDKFLRQPTLSDLSARTGIPKPKLSQWIKTGKLPAMEVRLHQRRFPAEHWKSIVKAAESLARGP
ncbi:MAG: hypothetical protein SF172_04185 [Burkholderiales bacterium]|nr:hypothetical protein [Burkholderiales bacterium]